MKAAPKHYGTIRYDEARRRWVVAAEPHALIKLRRLFPRLHVSRYKDEEEESLSTYEVGDTPEMCQDLLWFLQRYPMRFHPTNLERTLRRNANQYVEQHRTVADLLAGIRPPAHIELAVPLRDYQRLAVTLWHQTKGLLLADEVGLGKTATAIGGLARQGLTPALVVTLTHLPAQWQAELSRFAPALKTHILKRGPIYELLQPNRAGEPTLPDVIICNYHKLAKWEPVLAPLVKAVVFDEVQELRHGDGSNKGAAAYSIACRAEFRLGLSGTPIYNYGGEIYNVIQALRPDALGQRHEFLTEWCNLTDRNGNAQVRNPTAFGTYLRDEGIMLRRTRSDVGRELPPMARAVEHVEADLEHLDEIETKATNLAKAILSAQPAGRGEKFRAAEELSTLVRRATGVAKALYVAEFVKMVAASEQKIVLYGWHREVYSLWLEALSELNPVMFTGSETPKQKATSVQAFCEGEARVMIISLRAGAGLDGLQKHCSTVIFGELDWSPGVHHQCEGRIFRDGQPLSVYAYYLVSDYGSDPIVADVLGLKRAQSEGILDPGEELLGALQVDGSHIRKLAEAYLHKTKRDRRPES